MSKSMPVVDNFIFNEIDSFVVQAEKDIEGISYRLSKVLRESEALKTKLAVIRDLLPHEASDTKEIISQIDTQCKRVRDSLSHIFKSSAISHDALTNLLEMVPNPSRLQAISKQVLRNV